MKFRNRLSHNTPPEPHPRFRKKSASNDRARPVDDYDLGDDEHAVARGRIFEVRAEEAVREKPEFSPPPRLKLKRRQKKHQKPAAPQTKHGSVNGRPAAALKLTKAWKIGDPVPAKRWTALSHAVFKSPQVRALSHADKHLFVCLLVQCTGNNSGDLKCSFAYMSKHFGWVSPNTLNESRKRLIKLGLLMQVSEGFKGRAARYALTNCLVPQRGAEQ